MAPESAEAETSTMYTRCLACNAPFPRGSLTEHVPVGEGIAYDPERGRLWVICGACGGWTLAPINQRWEALEALERIVTARSGRRAVPAGRTDNVALFRVGATHLIRIGRTDLLEEAAWRYGRPTAGDGGGPNPFGPRRLRLGEWILGRAYLARTALSRGGTGGGGDAARRWILFGELAWQGEVRCGACDFVIRRLPFTQARTLILRDAGETSLTPSLVRACPRCRDEVTGGLQLEGTAAEFALRRVLAHQQVRGVPEGHLKAAIHLIELGGGAPGISSILARYGRYVGDLPITSAVALRILANQAYESRLLDLEAAAVERQWAREEELAAVIDGDLTWIPKLERMRRLMQQGSRGYRFP